MSLLSPVFKIRIIVENNYKNVRRQINKIKQQKIN